MMYHRREVSPINLLEKQWKKIEISNGKYHYHYLLYQFTKNSQSVGLIDCGNRFNPFLITNAAKFENSNPKQLLNMIKIIRVFTIFQLKTAIEKSLELNPDVIIISDIDEILKDQSVSKREKELALFSIMEKIQQIKTPIFIVGDSFMFTNIAIDN
ncbi:hypothetical protein [Persephonella sp.]